MIASIAIAIAAAVAGDACALLEPGEIAAVQGEAPKETRSNTRDEGQLRVSDCVFVLPTFTNSIVVQLSRGRGARRRWKQVFHRGRAARGEGPEEEERAPEPVRGIGDEAFWVAGGPTSALYVLRRDSFLRISLGGADPRDLKIARAKALVRKALRRL